MFLNEITGKEYETINGLSKSLRKAGVTQKEYYDKYIKTEAEGTCVYCGNETVFTKFAYRKFCGSVCSNKNNRNSLLYRQTHSKEELDEMYVRMVKTRRETIGDSKD